MGAVEDEIRAQGEEIFRLMEAGSPTVFDRKRWSGKLMDLAMSDPGLKVRLFRFVDVLPNLAAPEQIVAHRGDVGNPFKMDRMENPVSLPHVRLG